MVHVVTMEDSEVPSPLTVSTLSPSHVFKTQFDTKLEFYWSPTQHPAAAVFDLQSACKRVLCSACSTFPGLPPPFLSDAVISPLRLPGCSQSADRSACWLSEIQFVGVVSGPECLRKLMALFDEEVWERQLLDWRICSALCAVVFGPLPSWISLTRWKCVPSKLSASVSAPSAR